MKIKAEAMWLSLKVFSPALVLYLASLAGTVGLRSHPPPLVYSLCIASGLAYQGLVFLCGPEDLLLRLRQTSFQPQTLWPLRSAGVALLVLAAMLAASDILR